MKPPRKGHRDHRDVKVWEASELIRFRDRADEDDWAGAWRLTLSGLRRSEILGLTWSNVDFDRGVVRIAAGRVAIDAKRTAIDDPKSAASWRTIPVDSVHPGTLKHLLDMRDAQDSFRRRLDLSVEEWDRRTGDLVLVDSIGAPIRPEAYSDRFRALTQASRVPALRLHDVRHSVALMLHRAGVAPADAAALLGHTLGVHLSTYVPRTQRGIETAASTLGSALSSQASS